MFLFKILIGSRKENVSTITLKFISCEKKVTFETHSFSGEKLMMINAFIKGMVISNAGLGWSFLSNKFEVNLKLFYPDFSIMLPSIMTQYDTN